MDKPTCAVFNPKRRGLAPAWPITKEVAGRVLESYLENFPRIDPREFGMTGEATPAYIYSASALLMLQNALMSHTRLIILLRDPAERAFSEFKNKRDLMVGGAVRAHVWINGYADFDNFTQALHKRVKDCTPVQMYQNCASCRRFVQAHMTGDRREGTGRPKADTPGSAELAASHSRCYAPPIIWQSWYHIFLPSWMDLGQRLLIEFSEDTFTNADELMKRVATFLALPHFRFNTSLAFNVEGKRGASISNGEKNAALATTAKSKRSSASPEAMRIVERLMVDSVAQLDQILKTRRWTPAQEQHRRQLPEAWVKRYKL